jgi:lincosamide nucleotidyltransferase A/C/D/E
LTGTGTISGYAVRSISPQWMVKFHSGYELTEKDYQDVLSICEKYDIALPDEYSQFKDRS